MITFLHGRLTHALPTQATIDVNGVGYEVFIPLSSYDKLPMIGQSIEMLTHLHVREDAHILYGFMTAPERDLFRLLVNHVSGIGPKLALAVLSGMSVNNFKTAVVAAAWEAASATHAPTPEQEQANEAVLALIALGYKQVDGHKAVRDLQEKEGAGKTAEELVKLALKRLAAGR
ncbi:MAG: Holliday junction branch migration protein RuvA [Verrucomicrobia bacterium]|nr:MAG: Holliday junction branch migration protein RuvA [Verrucomicrobiota bacterium]